jgi:hypothetical protein
MATSIDNLTIALRIAGLFVNSNDLGNAEHRLSYNPSNQFSDGNAINKAEIIFSDTRTINASSAEDLDFGGGLTDVFGNALTFTKIKALLIVAAATNTNNVQVGGDASAAWVGWCADASDIVSVKPGGILLLTAPAAAGMAVVATTGDILQIANSSSGSSVTYTIVIVGTDS